MQNNDDDDEKEGGGGVEKKNKSARFVLNSTYLSHSSSKPT